MPQIIAWMAVLTLHVFREMMAAFDVDTDNVKTKNILKQHWSLKFMNVILLDKFILYFLSFFMATDEMIT